MPCKQVHELDNSWVSEFSAERKHITWGRGRAESLVFISSFPWFEKFSRNAEKVTLANDVELIAALNKVHCSFWE